MRGCGRAPVAGWRDPRRARAAAARVARSAAAQIPTNYRAVSRSSASRYLAAVLSLTAWGRRGAGGGLFGGGAAILVLVEVVAHELLVVTRRVAACGQRGGIAFDGPIA